MDMKKFFTPVSLISNYGLLVTALGLARPIAAFHNAGIQDSGYIPLYLCAAELTLLLPMCLSSVLLLLTSTAAWHLFNNKKIFNTWRHIYSINMTALWLTSFCFFVALLLAFFSSQPLWHQVLLRPP